MIIIIIIHKNTFGIEKKLDKDIRFFFEFLDK